RPSSRPSPGPAFGRRTAEGGHRAGDRHRSRGHRRRRAHRRPRSGRRRAGPRPDARPSRRTAQDHRDGHARSGGRGARRSHPSSRKGGALVTFGRVVVRDLARNPLRLSLTIVAATVGVLAFVFLQTVIDLWYSGVEHAAIDRLAVRNKTSLTQTLPVSYLHRIETVSGVTVVTFGGWFGGMKSESAKDFYPNFYVDSATYL